MSLQYIDIIYPWILEVTVLCFTLRCRASQWWIAPWLHLALKPEPPGGAPQGYSRGSCPPEHLLMPLQVARFFGFQPVKKGEAQFTVSFKSLTCCLLLESTIQPVSKVPIPFGVAGRFHQINYHIVERCELIFLLISWVFRLYDNRAASQIGLRTKGDYVH